jgi:hypothetical protein
MQNSNKKKRVTIKYVVKNFNYLKINSRLTDSIIIE